MEPLDNPVWHALTGPQQTVAEVHGSAARYRRDIAPFAALPDAPGAADWDDLATLVGPHHVAGLFRAGVDAPPEWEEVFRVPTVQMVAGPHCTGAPCAGAALLDADDVDDMLALVARTHPGPFEQRTIELGEYLGVRDGGTLVAMAGTRLHVPGHREISAVCTDESHRGRGLANALVRDLVARIRPRDETPMLHVMTTNVNALRIYEALGFTRRREFDVVGVRAPG